MSSSRVLRNQKDPPVVDPSSGDSSSEAEENPAAAETRSPESAQDAELTPEASQKSESESGSEQGEQGESHQLLLALSLQLASDLLH